MLERHYSAVLGDETTSVFIAKFSLIMMNKLQETFVVFILLPALSCSLYTSYYKDGITAISMHIADLTTQLKECGPQHQLGCEIVQE